MDGMGYVSTVAFVASVTSSKLGMMQLVAWKVASRTRSFGKM